MAGPVMAVCRFFSLVRRRLFFYLHLHWHEFTEVDN